MVRSVQVSFALVGVVVAVGIAGCTDSGPKTARVKGTLTINGEPANNVTVSFVPLDSSQPAASGQVTDGSFELFSGVQGTPGAAPGKYKVVLAAVANADADAAAYMSGQGGAPPQQELPFPEKYKDASTSDKEVEVTSGSNDIKIDISG